MKICNPFEIVLDSYCEECKNLYAVVQSICDLPKMQYEEDDLDFGTENKLYATAFAYICHDYLVRLKAVYAHEDFEAVSDRMNFEENVEVILEIAKSLNIGFDETKIQQQKNAINLNEEYYELVYNLIKTYRRKIATKIKALFTKDELQLCFFSSIFSMDETNEFEPSTLNYIYPDLFLK